MPYLPQTECLLPTVWPVVSWTTLHTKQSLTVCHTYNRQTVFYLELGQQRLTVFHPTTDRMSSTCSLARGCWTTLHIKQTDRTSDDLAPLKTSFVHAPACLMCTIHAHEPMNSHWLPPRQYKFNQASSDIFSIFSFCSFFVVTLFNTVMSLRSTVGVQVLLLLIGFI